MNRRWVKYFVLSWFFFNIWHFFNHGNVLSMFIPLSDCNHINCFQNWNFPSLFGSMDLFYLSTYFEDFLNIIYTHTRTRARAHTHTHTHTIFCIFLIYWLFSNLFYYLLAHSLLHLTCIAFHCYYYIQEDVGRTAELKQC